MFFRGFKNYLGIILFILKLFNYNIYCQECECSDSCNKDTCTNLNSNCRFFVADNSCLKCEGLTNESPYYKKGDEGQCIHVTIKGDDDKVIDGNNEVISENCPNNYKNLGDFCYSSDNSLITEDTPYACTGFYYIEKKELGFIYYNCLESGIECSDNDFNIVETNQCFSCPSNYKYYDIDDTTKLVNCYSNSCPSGKDHKKKEVNSRNIAIYRCTIQCDTSGENKEFEYKDSNGNYYCLDQCPNEAKYYYETPVPETEPEIIAYSCRESCSEGHYAKGNICTDTCDESKIITVDLTKTNKFKCTEEEACSDSFPYLYTDTNDNNKKYCLKSCKDTKEIFFKENSEGFKVGIITYISETVNNDDGGEEIVKECLEEKTNFYKDEISLKWVSDCQTSIGGPYYNESKFCKNSCEKYFTLNELKCVDECPNVEETDYKYLDKITKTCYKECPSNLGRGFINENENYCQSCKVPTSSTPEEGEGFYKSNDKKCYSECDDDDGFYNYGENYCFSEDCTTKNLYRKEDSNICYKSCLDIEDGSYKKEKDNICYIDFPDDENINNYYYYKTSSGTYKYIDISQDPNNAFEECSSFGLKYLKNFQCVKECDKNDYILIQTGNQFGICFSDLQTSKDEGYVYYNKTKFVSTSCNFFKIQKLQEGSTTEYEETEIDGENCVTECPNDYYEYVEDKVCKREYDNTFYILEESNKKKCITEDNCDKFKFFDGTQKKCVDKCKIENKFIYYDDSENKNCIESCLTNIDENKKFSFETLDDHLPCLSESDCPSDYHYFEDEKIFRKDCGEYFYDKNNKKICVKNCGDGEYIHPGNICSDKSCPPSAPFYYEETKAITNEEQEIINIHIKKCVSNCDENHFYKVIDCNTNEGCTQKKECIENCPLSYNSRCYENCPEGLYKSGNVCIPKCEPNIFEEEKDSDGNVINLVCIPHCPKEETSQNKYITSYGKCVDECPEGENYISIDEKSCLTNCGNNFFRKQQDKNLYNCVENCGSEVHYEGSKECKTDCGSDLYLYESNLNNTCYQVCSSTDKPFSTISNEDSSKKICYTTCNGDDKFYGNDKVCKPDCNHLAFNKTINDSNNECISSCDLKSEYKYLQEKENGENPHCQTQCDNGYERYIMPNYICAKQCKEPNNFVVRDNSQQIECLSKCPSSEQFAQYDEDESKKEYYCTENECDSNSDYKFYYLEDKICLNHCKENDYQKKEENICMKSCVSNQLYFDDDNKLCVSNCLDVSGKEYTKINGHCDDKCNEGEFYNEHDLKCKIKCSANEKIDGQICRENCSTSDGNKYEDENRICVSKCEDSKTGYIYYNIDFGNVCQKDCPNKFIKGHTCVNSCLDNEINADTETGTITNFYNDNICDSTCPVTKRYITYISNGETTPNQPPYECLSDCKNDTVYYSSNENLPDIVYACKSTCPAFIISMDSKVNGRICFDDGICPEKNNYYIKVNENKECLTQCPTDRPYMKSDESQNIECLLNCPPEYVHLTNNYNCIPISECDSKKIKYKTSECVKECAKNETKYLISDSDIYYCIDNCSALDNSITSSTLYLTYDNECLPKCPQNTHNNGSNFCECNKLFYFDQSTQIKKCISEEECKDFSNYPIKVHDSNECIAYCDGILSIPDNECFRTEHDCVDDFETLKTKSNGDKYCDCIDKYYFDQDNSRKVCLKKGGKCPSDFNLYVKDTKECVYICPSEYPLKFQNTCVKECPDSSEPVGENECKCSENGILMKKVMKLFA